jgi:hypothetical protein
VGFARHGRDADEVIEQGRSIVQQFGRKVAF